MVEKANGQWRFQLHQNKSPHLSETLTLDLGYDACMRAYLYTFIFTASSRGQNCPFLQSCLLGPPCNNSRSMYWQVNLIEAPESNQESPSGVPSPVALALAGDAQEQLYGVCLA